MKLLPLLCLLFPALAYSSPAKINNDSDDYADGEEFAGTDLSDLTGMEVYAEPSGKSVAGGVNVTAAGQPKQPLSRYAVQR